MDRRVVVIQNTGRISRYYLEGIALGLKSLGIDPLIFELGEYLALPQPARRAKSVELARQLQKARPVCAISYACLGLFEFPHVDLQDGRKVPFFEGLNIPHCMVWSDNPQWFDDQVALRPEAQAFVRSPNNYHFLKSPAAAEELSTVLNWPNCNYMPMAESPEFFKPVNGVQPEYDVVAISGSLSVLPSVLAPFLTQDSPRFSDMKACFADDVRTALRARLGDHAGRFIDDLCIRCIECDDADPVRHFTALEPEYREQLQTLRSDPVLYFSCRDCLTPFFSWQRAFMLEYLKRHFNLGIFGKDKASTKALNGWVDFLDQPSCYARGRLAINIPHWGDMEGLTHKPFQIAASGVPMVHYWRDLLDDCFEPGVECDVFRTPSEARELIQGLLDNPGRALEMAGNAHERFLAEHTWANRIEQMLDVVQACH